MSYVYRSYEDLHRLGTTVRDKAIQVTLSQSESYGQAQERANNDAARVESLQPPLVGGYAPPTSGAPDDYGNLRRYLALEYSGLPEMFTAFSVPDPNACGTMAKTLYSAAATLEPSLELTPQRDKLTTPLLAPAITGTQPVAQTVDSAVVHMKSWYGDAATAFEGYVKSLTHAADLQRNFATSLAQLLEAQLEIRRCLLTDAWEIGQQTLKALESLDGWCPSGNSVTVTLTVAGAVAATVFAFVTEGFGSAIAVEGVQSAATILSAISSAGPAQAAIGGPTVPQVISSMRTAMDRVWQALDAQERDLVYCTQQLTAALRRRSDYVQPTPPNFDTLSTAGLDILDSERGFHDR